MCRFLPYSFIQSCYSEMPRLRPLSRNPYQYFHWAASHINADLKYSDQPILATNHIDAATFPRGPNCPTSQFLFECLQEDAAAKSCVSTRLRSHSMSIVWGTLEVGKMCFKKTYKSLSQNKKANAPIGPETNAQIRIFRATCLSGSAAIFSVFAFRCSNTPHRINAVDPT